MDFRLPPISLNPVADAEELAFAALGRGGVPAAAPAAAAPPRMLRRATRPRSAGGAVTTVVQPGEENIRRALELMSAEDDYSAAQEYAKQRGVEGQSALLNALAAQYAGERFAPVGQMYLKRSLASQDPLRVGSAMISPDGTVLKDPSASREREAGRLMQLGQFEMTLADRQQARADEARRAADARALRQAMAGQGSWQHVQDPNTGQVMLYNTRSGERMPLAGSQSGDTAPAAAAPGSMAFKPGFNIPQGGMPKLTEVEDKSRFFAANMADALGPMSTVLQQGYSPSRIDQAAAGPPASGWLGRTAAALTPRSSASPEGRTFYTEGRKVLASILRKESGAAITDDEWSSYGPIYLPWPGDQPADVERKMQVLYSMANNMAQSSGPAYRFWTPPTMPEAATDDDGVIDLPSPRGR